MYTPTGRETDRELKAEVLKLTGENTPAFPHIMKAFINARNRARLSAIPSKKLANGIIWRNIR